MLQVLGFGVHKFEPSKTSELSTNVQRADLPIVPYEKCFQTGNDATFWKNLFPGENFCAGYKNAMTSTCQGDSGGGIAFKVNGRWFLRGIVSFGPVRYGSQFCDPNNYSVFLDVAYYLEWIEKSIEAKRSTGVKFSSLSEYLIQLVIEAITTYYGLLLLILALGLLNACALIISCRKRTERKSKLQFYANPEATSSEVRLIWLEYILCIYTPSIQIISTPLSYHPPIL